MHTALEERGRYPKLGQQTQDVRRGRAGTIVESEGNLGADLSVRAIRKVQTP